MKVDYYLPAVPASAAPAAARRAARLGFDGFFTAETSHEPFMPLALAAVTEPGLDLGTAIAVAFPRSPMIVAQTAWDLAGMAGGRFILGLGTQVKPHIVRRFSTEWTAPVPRLREYIGALRAIWRSFQTGESLRFSGDHYQFSLMTPFFNPGPIDHPDIPVTIAGVGPGLARLAGEACDGFHVHPFHTVRYLDEVVRPAIEAGAAHRQRPDVELIGTVFVVTGRDEAEMSASLQMAKGQIAFYASTPSYRRVLDIHGWDFGDVLNRMSRRGEWERMAEVIPDAVVEDVAVVAPVEAVGRAIRARYGRRLARVGFYTLSGGPELDDDDVASMVAATKG